MRSIFAIVAFVLAIGLDAQAMTMVPRDFPGSNHPQAGQSELAMTVAIYQNGIVILALPPASHEVKVSKSAVDPTWVKTLTSKTGTPATQPNLIRALQAELKSNPKAALPASLAAFKIARDSGFSSTAPVSMVLAALQVLKSDQPESLNDIAVLIGFAVAAAAEDQYPNVLRQLRSFVIFQSGPNNRPDFVRNLDLALDKFGVVEVKFGNEEFFAAVDTFLPNSDLGELSQDNFDMDTALFQIENGVYSPADGALLVSPFTGGASGTAMNPAPGNNNTSPNPVPTPSQGPTPPPGPTPTPTPTPTPSPEPTPPIPVS